MELDLMHEIVDIMLDLVLMMMYSLHGLVMNALLVKEVLQLFISYIVSNSTNLCKMTKISAHVLIFNRLFVIRISNRLVIVGIEEF
uniref:Secreted protein n=1 Tax=Schistosoma curassoni TaxID=6186 RepID=A0A183KGD0_9TREM